MANNFRNSVIIFLDEAVGFRKSVHHLHRWFETNNDSELEQLALEIARENFVDLWPIIHFIKDGTHHSEAKQILSSIVSNGIHMPKDWIEANRKEGTYIPQLPVPLFDSMSNSFEESTANLWKLRDWVDYGYEQLGFNPMSAVGMLYQYIIDARTDFKQIFKALEMMFGYDTLASCVHNGSNKLFAEVISKHYYPDYNLHIKYLLVAMDASPDLNWVDALSRNQVKSKMWLLNKIKDLPEYKRVAKLGDTETTTVVVGGWVGILPFLAHMMGIQLGNVINVDIDTSVHGASITLNAGFYKTYKTSSEDIRSFNFKKYKSLVIIDTIVEHFEDHGEWVKTLPSHAKIVLQGNDMFHVPDHVNCHKYIDEFESSCGVNNIIWSGELNLYKCTRFMVIGSVK